MTATEDLSNRVATTGKRLPLSSLSSCLVMMKTGKGKGYKILAVPVVAQFAIMAGHDLINYPWFSLEQGADPLRFIFGVLLTTFAVVVGVYGCSLHLFGAFSRIWLQDRFPHSDFFAFTRLAAAAMIPGILWDCFIRVLAYTVWPGCVWMVLLNFAITVSIIFRCQMIGSGEENDQAFDSGTVKD